MQAQENKSERSRREREKRRERETDRQTERERDGERGKRKSERKRERERERERDRERDREREEFHGEITSTSAQSEIFKPSHSHITNNSIYCRCKMTWSPMYGTNKNRQTEMLMVGHSRHYQH